MSRKKSFAAYQRVYDGRKYDSGLIQTKAWLSRDIRDRLKEEAATHGLLYQTLIAGALEAFTECSTQPELTIGEALERIKQKDVRVSPPNSE